MNARSFHLTAQGASHIKKNKECQDASSSYQDENCVIAIVCDGHGGDDYVRSAIGSKIGCAVAEKNIKNFFLGIDKETFFSDPDKHLKNLEASIINGWNEAISTYHSTHPFQDSELSIVSEKARKKYVEDGKIWSAYGTTMIAVAMNQDYWFGIHIGDGKCVAINPEGEFKQPIPWDPKCFLNATTSICDSDAIERFRHFYSEKLPAAAFVGSDGIDDCFSNNEQLHNLYKTVLYSFATTDFDEACAGLEDYLPRLSAKGSGDDVSVAALLDLDLIPELSIVKEYDREKEKARVEENARKEAEKNEAEKRRVEEEHARFQQQNNAKSKKTPQVGMPKFCENCGERIRPGVKFCSNCGAKINSIEPSEKTSANRQGVQVIKIAPFSSEPEHETLDQLEEVDVKKVTAPDLSDSVEDTEAGVSISEAIVDTEGSKEVITEDGTSSASTSGELLESEGLDEVNEESLIRNEEDIPSVEPNDSDEFIGENDGTSGVDESDDAFGKMNEETSNGGEQAANQNTSDDKDELESENTLKQETDI